MKSGRVGVVAFALVLALVAGFELYAAPRALPGAVAAGVPVGGLTVSEAAERIAAAGAASPPVVTVVFAGRSVPVSAAALGWRADAAATARAAVSAGRSGGLFAWWPARLGLRRVPPVAWRASVDAGVARAKLESISRSAVVEPRSAAIVFAGGGYVVRRDVPGARVDAAGAARAFAADPTLTRLSLVSSEVRAATLAADLAGLAESANALLRPLTLVYRRGAVVKGVALTSVEVANLFFVRREGLVADDEAIVSVLRRLSRAFDVAARDARFVPASSGGVKVRPERAGWALDVSAARARVSAAVLDGSVSEVVVPVRLVAPLVSAEDLPDPASLEVISEASTRFKGSSVARATNVRVAAGLLDGAVMPAGEVFSFNEAIGPIELESGFKAALVISSGRTVEGVGGGVCQVSTTAFRAMYAAGLPVVERNQHAYRVHWYDPIIGFDAAVYQPVLDLRMRNDTGAPIVVRAVVDDAAGTVTVRLLGVKPERTVVVGDPVILERTPHPPAAFEVNPALRAGERRQVDWAADGFRVRITRKVFEGGSMRSDVLATNYRPWRAVYEVGPSAGSVAAAR